MGSDPKYSFEETKQANEAKTEEDKIKENGEGWLLINTLTGKTSRMLSEYDAQLEDDLETYELVFFTWGEEKKEPQNTLF